MNKARVLSIDEVVPRIVAWGTTRILIDQKTVGADGLEVRFTEMCSGQIHELHAHDVEEVIFVLSGKGIHTDEERRLNIGSGNVIYIPAGVKHKHECVGNEPLKLLVVFASSKLHM